MYTCCLFFFFQAEDGIRDGHVTGVQTCALPIFGTELDVLLEGIDREIEKVQQDLITEQEYQKLQNKFESDFIQDNTSMLSIAESLANYHTYYGDEIGRASCRQRVYIPEDYTYRSTK